MKFLIVFAALFAVALAAPRPDAEILKSDSDVGPENYNFAYATSDGVEHQSSGVLNNVGSDHESLAVKGSYSWTDEKTGEKFTVTYVADENGFQPSGAHLPVA
ncbi:larval cuticle protein 65Ab1-like [Stomoxys calcitrans]|uniref:larval cuticle protein 65Ab1-like n=1 Tax=Stomoxys calcitrans TaxID=35570 RepID=UPI0027E3474E|nr:larval cuticle protein 65Ab1-like [Stomoxys calcitrans]